MLRVLFALMFSLSSLPALASLALIGPALIEYDGDWTRYNIRIDEIGKVGMHCRKGTFALMVVMPGFIFDGPVDISLIGYDKIGNERVRISAYGDGKRLTKEQGGPYFLMMGFDRHDDDKDKRNNSSRNIYNFAKTVSSEYRVELKLEGNGRTQKVDLSFGDFAKSVENRTDWLNFAAGCYL